MEESLPIFDGFDSSGRPTGGKVLVCMRQYINCQYQKPYADGAVFICSKYDDTTDFECEKMQDNE